MKSSNLSIRVATPGFKHTVINQRFLKSMNNLKTELDPDIDACIVTLPGFVSLQALQEWGSEILGLFENRIYFNKLLLDTNAHNFESIECLKWLKEFLQNELVAKGGVNKIVFVQPENYRYPQIVSDSEAYFTNVCDAREWLASGELKNE